MELGLPFPWPFNLLRRAIIIQLVGQFCGPSWVDVHTTEPRQPAVVRKAAKKEADQAMKLILTLQHEQRN
jgi:hypothetical protein